MAPYCWINRLTSPFFSREVDSGRQIPGKAKEAIESLGRLSVSPGLLVSLGSSFAKRPFFEAMASGAQLPTSK